MRLMAKARAELADGVYEHLVTDEFAERIAAVLDTRTIAQDEFDTGDAHVVLARHLARELMRVLDDVPKCGPALGVARRLVGSRARVPLTSSPAAWERVSAEALFSSPEPAPAEPVKGSKFLCGLCVFESIPKVQKKSRKENQRGRKDRSIGSDPGTVLAHTTLPSSERG